MSVPGYFQTIAEIGVAIAGFSGLIVSLRKGIGPLVGVQKFRLQLLLSLALGAMFLSLLPELLTSLGVKPERLWKQCSFAALCFSGVFLSWWIVASLRVHRIEPEIFNWFAFSRMSAGHGLVVAVQVAFLFSLVGVPGSAVFAMALIWYLLHAAQQFTRMLFIPARSDLSQDST